MDSNIPSTSSSVLVWQMVPGDYSIHVNGTNKGTSTSTLLPEAFDKVGNDLIGHIAEVVAYDRGLSDGVLPKTGRLPRSQMGTGIQITLHPFSTKQPNRHLVAARFLLSNPNRTNRLDRVHAT